MISGPDFVVPPQSWAAIEGVCARLRKILGLEQEPFFPVMDVLDRIIPRYIDGFALEAGDNAEMDGAEGYTDPQGTFIRLREDVMRAAWAGNTRARFTAAHELGHLVLHTNVVLARIGNGADIPAYRRAEPQANFFAAAVLMPRDLVPANAIASEVMKMFGVSADAAEHRLDYLRRK